MEFLIHTTEIAHGIYEVVADSLEEARQFWEDAEGTTELPAVYTVTDIEATKIEPGEL